MHLIDSGKATAQENMDRDAALLEELGNEPVLHLYGWQEPSATYGYFIEPSDYLDLDACREVGLDLGRRPTGGGIIFHVSDLAFSLLIPAGHEGYSDNTLANYQYVNRRVQRAIETVVAGEAGLLPEEPVALDASSANFCMAKPTIYDVMLGPRKVAGAAQRRKRHGYLHQGSISISMPERALLERVLLPGTRVLESMEQTSHFLGEEVREALKQQLIEEFHG